MAFDGNQFLLNIEEEKCEIVPGSERAAAVIKQY